MRAVEPDVRRRRDHRRPRAVASVVPRRGAEGHRPPPEASSCEELAPTVPADYDARAITIGVRRSEYRIAYVLGGDLVAAIDYLRRFDRDIGRSAEEPRLLLTHPVTNEMLRYALSAEAVAERRRVGASWG